MNHVKIQKLKTFNGFISKFLSPSIFISLEYPKDTNSFLEDGKKQFLSLISEIREFSVFKGNQEFLNEKDYINTVLKLLMLHHHIFQTPVFDTPKILIEKISEDEQSSVQLMIPTPLRYQKATVELFNLLTIILSRDCSDQWKNYQNDYMNLLRKLNSLKDHRTNNYFFLKAAHESSIFYSELPGRLLQFGYASNSRILDSSITDRTSSIAVNIANNKITTNALLKLHGIPAPESFFISSLDSAKKIATRIGYPVVIKPINTDRGVGVSVNLKNDDEVERAFNNAQKISKNILVEKFFLGRDYRILIVDQKVVWAVERSRPSVVGDGVKSVKELVDDLNHDPKRGLSPAHPLKPVDIDEDLQRCIASQNTKLETILNKEQMLRLRDIANVSKGATPIEVLGQVHSDNINLFLRVAKALNLDVAGIDFIIPDISMSWKTQVSVICEVNVQPQIGRFISNQLHQKLLNMLLINNGRIPIICCLGMEEDSKVFVEILNFYKQKYSALGVATSNKFKIFPDNFEGMASNMFKAAKVLVADKNVDAMIVLINDFELLNTGLPFMHIDFLVVGNISNVKFNLEKFESENHDPHLIQKNLFALLSDYLEGKIVDISDNHLNKELLDELKLSPEVYVTSQPDRILETLNSFILN
jgi:cyanophycin synthetase